MKTKSILEIIGSLLLIAIAVLFIGSYAPPAEGGQYDVLYAIRASGTGAVLMPYLGSSGTWEALATTDTNGVVQTTGNGLAANPGLVLAGTAAIQAEVGGTLTSITPWTLGLSATGGVVKFTGTTWSPVP